MIESQYLGALNDELDLDTWRRIVRRAIEHAEDGDWRARDWLSRYVLPQPKAQLLLKLAAEEERGLTRDDRVATTALRQEQQEQLQDNAYRALL